MSIKSTAKQAATVTLGVLFPLVILVQAYLGLAALEQGIGRQMEPEAIAALYERVQPKAKSPNDYALFSQMFSENVNQAVITNKQVIKIVVIQIGFAAMSLGLMFVLLGINDGGGEGGVDIGNVKVDFKTASTGALVFAIGAGMATAGGVMRNEYKAVPLPNFVPVATNNERQARTEEAYEKCQAAGGEFPDCFVTLYAKIHGKDVK